MIRSSWTWKNVRLPAEIAERLGLEFEAGLLDAALEPVAKAPPTADRTPSGQDVSLLCHLSELFGQLQRIEDALRVDETLVRLCPDEPTHHYNLACRLSILGSLDAAFAALSHAMVLGFDHVERLRDDPDLDNLRDDVRFAEILAGVDP